MIFETVPCCRMAVLLPLPQVAKICNNLAMAIEMAAISEALALGKAAGMDPAQLTAVFNASSARCWSSEVYNPSPVSAAPSMAAGGCISYRYI